MMFKRSILAMCACTGMTFICAASGGRAKPLHRWMFEDGEPALKLSGAGFAMSKGHGRCLSFSRASDRASAEAGELLHDIPSKTKPYTMAIWLKPDAGLVPDSAVEMSKLGGRRMTKFMFAMNDGKWHHLAIAHDPRRKGREYTLWIDWHDESSPRRFTSDNGKDSGSSKCVLPLAISKGKASFGGNVGFGLITKGYVGLVDDVAVFDRPLSSAELSCFLSPTNAVEAAKE